VSPDLQNTIGILAAALGGAAVGVEREWSGHARGPEAHFAGVRTFTLLGGLAGTAGCLWSMSYEWLSTIVLAGAVALVVGAYVAASRRDVDGTTEVAALVVLAAGVLAGTGHLRLASGVIAVTTLLLVEKSYLHSLVARIDDTGLRAGFRFAVMAVVILPLLPSGPYGPLGGIRPRQLWALVLFFSGLSFAGYIARRMVGARQAYPIAGLLGGIISSTSVTLSFARVSRAEENSAEPLAFGVIAASAVMYLRVLVTTTVLNRGVARVLIAYLVAPFLISALAALFGSRKRREEIASTKAPSNPLQFSSALQMAILFQLVIFAVHWAGEAWGQLGVLLSAGVLGLTDVDALVVSMTRDATSNISVRTAAQAIAIGVLTNTLLKLVVGVAVGRQRFRPIVAAGFATMAVASAASIMWIR
jgi:uncharacterized membrane protein (DUF4010 family)